MNKEIKVMGEPPSLRVLSLHILKEAASVCTFPWKRKEWWTKQSTAPSVFQCPCLLLPFGDLPSVIKKDSVGKKGRKASSDRVLWHRTFYFLPSSSLLV